MTVRTTLIVFAVHHLNNNIASHRFRGLANCLEARDYDIHIFAHSGARNKFVQSEAANITVHAVPGATVGATAGRLATLLVLLSAKFRSLPFMIRSPSNWTCNAVRYSQELIEVLKRRGDSTIVVVGTHSPTDAIVAGSCLARKYNIPLILDFRDGFAFESLGRKSVLARTVRKWVERSLVTHSSLVTSVTRANVDYFRGEYPRVRTELLSNGFDAVPMGSASLDSDGEKAATVLSSISSGKPLLGLFGRISGSDATSLPALRFLVKTLNESASRDKIHVLVVGDLTPNDIEAFAGLSASKTLLPAVERPVAQALMRKMDALLLITGDRTGHAPGKLFEYLNAGPPIGCFSMVGNEAARILSETGSGREVVEGDFAGAERFFYEVANGRFKTPRNEQRISSYSRQAQAQLLDRYIRQVSQHGYAVPPNDSVTP